MVELTLRFELTERVPHADKDLRLDVRSVKRREHPLHRERRHILQGKTVSSGSGIRRLHDGSVWPPARSRRVISS